MELKELTNRIISRKRIISALLILIMAFTAFWIYSETLQISRQVQYIQANFF